MAVYKLYLRFDHRFHSFLILPEMSLTNIKETVGGVFGISEDTFEIQVYNERFQCSIVLDDEYVEDLQQHLSRTYITTLSGDVLLNCSASGELQYMSLKLVFTFLNTCLLF
jgi:hypothetical protein